MGSLWSERNKETCLILKTTDGKDVLIDDEDFLLLSPYSWSATTGYAVRSVSGVALSMHRQLMRPKPGLVVDHINGNRLDNRKENLRVITHQENSRNRGPSKSNRTGHLGVSYDWRFQVYAAHIDREVIGHFPTLSEAITARLMEERSRWGIQPRRRAAFEAAGLI